jgi:YesN/AraC family two-component response regulator
MKPIKNFRVLVIDDEAAVSRVLVLMLKKIGFNHIDTAGNGRQGISKIDRNTYDLIFTDIEMPGLKGTQVLDYIRKRNHSTSVIGISGTPWLLTHQFDAVLSKPFTKSELIEVLDTIDIKPPSPDPKKKSCKQKNHWVKPGSPP